MGKMVVMGTLLLELKNKIGFFLKVSLVCLMGFYVKSGLS